MKYLLFILILFLPAKFSFAQNDLFKAFNIAQKALDKQPENYIAPIRAIVKIKPDTAKQLEYNVWCQAMMTYYSYIGDYHKSVFYYDEAFNHAVTDKKAGYDTAFVKEHHLVDAADYITEQAAKHQIVMINEAHYLPFHRAFVLSILKRFYDAGYRYMPVEAVSDSSINQKKYPDHQTGTYTQEPLFGEMIREAKRLGFKLIAYDNAPACNAQGKDRDYCGRTRDSIMAVNVAAIFKNDPKAKVLIYAGHDHIHEGSEDGWKKMAQFLKEMTGIDPLTIETTKQVDHFGTKKEEFLAVNRIKNISKAVVALKGNEPWRGEFVDVTVIFPGYLKEKGRPSYLSIDGRRKFYSLANRHIRPGQLIQAFYANEKPGERIPADQFVVGNKSDGLYLFKGQYVLQVKDADGNLLKSARIVVN